MIQFQRVSKHYGNSINAIKDISFTIDEGEFVFLIGPSGSGKTTLIKMLIRDEKPTDGKIYFDDVDITHLSRRKIYKLRRQIGVIFQDFKLIPDKTSFENVAFAMEASGRSSREIREKVPYLLDVVGLSHRMKAFPRQLSGGEQQRVAIARAMANNPKLLIADEPTGNLDPGSSWDIVQILAKINSWGTTVVMSTHGTEIVNALNKRVIQMEKGNIIRDDSKGQYEFTKSKINILDEQQNKEEENKKVKKKKNYSVNLTEKIKNKASKDDLEENTLENDEFLENEIENQEFITNPPKKGILGKFMFWRKDNGEYLVEEIEEDSNFEDKMLKQMEDEENEEENESEEILEDLRENSEEEVKNEAKNSKNQLSTEDEKKEWEEVSEEVEEKEKKHSNNLSSKGKTERIQKNETKKISLKLNLDKDEESEELERPLKFSSEKELKDKIVKKKKMPVEYLHLPGQTLNDLKKAGYENIGQLIDDGPEELSKNISLNPEEVVMIAKALEKILEEK